ncbi:MAG: glycosyltransferase, partial [Pirellulaceae bacterium]
LFALTSKNEASPVSILEAMSVALPIVAPRVGSIPQAVDEGNSGFLVPAGDLNQTSQAIATLLQDAELRRTMGRRGREKVQAYGSLESMVQGYEDLILTVYQTKRPHGKVCTKPPVSAPEQVSEQRQPIPG